MTLENIPNGQCNSVVSNGQNKNHVHPRSENSRTGKSVGYALHSEALHWFPIRATYHRARTVYDKLVSINDGSFEPYLPMQYMVEYDEKNGTPERKIKEEPLDKGLLFMRTTLGVFQGFVQNPSLVPGLTPYYNHFSTNEFGKNEFLTVPDRQMESFRIIVESQNQDIIVKQSDVPRLIEGDLVVVIGGPFTGVEGIVMKHKHQKRVFVQLHGIGTYATAYIPSAFLERKAEM